MNGKLTEAQRKALEGAFNDLDYDKSGNIPKSELRSALQLIGQNPTVEDMIACFEGTDRNGTFTKDEYFDFINERVTIKERERIDKELAEAFGKFDDDMDMFISKDDFRKIMTKMGDEPLTEKEADALLAEKDNQINITELSKLFMD